MPRCGPGCTAGQPGFIALHAGEVPVFTTCNTLKADRDGSRVGIEAVVAGLPGLIAALVACDGGDGGDAGGFAVVDSAGVRIATSASPQWPEGGGWSLAEAILDIGAAGNDPDHELFRVLGAVRLPGGGVVVANSGSGELRFFAADGTLVRRVGRKGEGPGEFTRIEGFWPFRGDSPIVWDRGLARLRVFSATGELGRVFAPERKGLNPRVLRPLDDGSFILEDGSIRGPMTGPGPSITTTARSTRMAYLWTRCPRSAHTWRSRCRNTGSSVRSSRLAPSRPPVAMAT